MTLKEKILNRLMANPVDPHVLALERTLFVERRRSLEYFSLIERIETQRDEWKRMYMEQSVQHQQAQALLQEALYSTRILLERAVRVVNEYRKRDGQPLVNKPKDLLDEPMGLAERFKEAMRVLTERATVPIDAKLERDRIASRAFEETAS